MKVRSHRSKIGLTCSVCGTAGYYPEICPNDCGNRPRTPDSDDTPPPSPLRMHDGGLGILWNIPAEDSVPAEKKSAFKKLNERQLRADSLNEVANMRKADEPIARTEFFHRAAEGYNRTLSELTLHQVMRRLMRLLERDILENCRKLEAVRDDTLLLPSKESHEYFYPEALRKYKDYNEYFLLKESKKGLVKNHQHKGAYRTDDINSKVDPFEEDPDAGATSHSKTGENVLLRIFLAAV